MVLYQRSSTAGDEPTSPLHVVLQAAIESSRDLGNWDINNWSNEDRNEQWTTSYVGIRLNDYARTIARSKSVLVTFESKVSWLNEHCGKSSEQRSSGLGEKQRFDIAVWQGDSIVGLVEVKNAPRTNDRSFCADILKMKQALDGWGLDHGGTLQWAVFLFSCTPRRGGGTDYRRALHSEMQRRLEQCAKALHGALDVTASPVEDVEHCRLGWAAVQFTP